MINSRWLVALALAGAAAAQAQPLPTAAPESVGMSSERLRRIETFFTQLNGEGFIVDRPAHVYVVPADGTGTLRNLTPSPFQHDGVSWLADSCGTRQRRERPARMTVTGEKRGLR